MELELATRTKLGKKAKQLRAEGRIPGELYGHGAENMHVSVDGKEFKKAFAEAGESSVLTAVIGGEKRPVLIYDVSRNPVSGEIANIDFYQVRLDEEITVRVPLEFVGESPAVKGGGILVKSLQELEVEALPLSIPHSIAVDISVLNEIGKSVYVKDISLPQGVKAGVDGNTVVATASEKMTEEEEKRLEMEGRDVESVKVEVEEKKQERASRDAQAASEGEAQTQ